MTYTTEQEQFWRGAFGDHYVDRNQDPVSTAANIAMFSTVLRRTRGIARVLELGANVGLNLRAIRQLLPHAALSAVEINEKAATTLREVQPDVELTIGSILEFKPQQTWDLVFTKGVLIHLNPERLAEVYELMYRASGRYLLVAEYYNPSPVQVTYRGHSERLFKRDFAGELLDRFADLALVDYGFVYRRDPVHRQDDLTWFLLEKRQPAAQPDGKLAA
jgi:spore coat polysaccharide biosynthesis protein SpsF